MALKKTGECNFCDSDGNLWCATSYMDEDTGEVSTQDVLVDAVSSAEVSDDVNLNGLNDVNH